MAANPLNKIIRAVAEHDRRTAERDKLAQIILAIEAEQVQHPGFAQDTLDAIVNSELRRLERESDCNLDEIGGSK